MVNRANGHRANGIRADVIAPTGCPTKFILRARQLEICLTTLNLFITLSRQPTLTCIVLETITTKFV